MLIVLAENLSRALYTCIYIFHFCHRKEKDWPMHAFNKKAFNKSLNWFLFATDFVFCQNSNPHNVRSDQCGLHDVCSSARKVLRNSSEDFFFSLVQKRQVTIIV